MYYLIIQPISEDPAEVAPLLDPLKVITGLDTHSLKQRLQGSSLNILMHSKEREPLDDIRGKLSREAINSVVVSKAELKEPQKALRAASIVVGSDYIELHSKENRPLLTIDKGTTCLVVISCKDFKKINTKRIARHVMSFTEPMTPDEKLKAIFVNRPVLEIYSKDSGKPIRIDSTRFNYTTLGEMNQNSAALNFQTIVELISKHAGQVVIESGYGENSLPFLNSLTESNMERAFRDFGTYSLFVSLAYDRGIFQLTSSTVGTGLIPVPILDELTKVFWAGPANRAKSKGSKDEDSPEKSTSNIDQLPPVPKEFSRSKSKFRSRFLAGRATSGFTLFIKALGPGFIFYPLSLVMLASFCLIYLTGSTGPLSLSLMSAGLMIFSHSFVLIKRKRLFENTPRSKIRSMPMGEVEVGGKARQKYYLKSPYTYTNCIYYSYKIFELVNTKDGQRWSLKEYNDSGRVPFYLEDDTGRTLIMPEKAILHAGVKETISGDMLSSVFGTRSAINNRKIVEITIPAGQFLYILGYAHRLRSSHSGKKKEMNERLIDLKHDKAKLNKYDTDGDGKISSEEWDAAREDVEDQILNERLEAGQTRDEVAVGVHPSGGLFIISDKKEAHLIKSMAWKIPLLLVTGSGATLAGVFFILKIIRNNDILLLLNTLFSNLNIN